MSSKTLVIFDWTIPSLVPNFSESNFIAQKVYLFTVILPNHKVRLNWFPLKKNRNLVTMFSTYFQIFIYIST